MAPNLTTYSSNSKLQIIERLKPSDILSSLSSCFKNVGGNFFFTYNSKVFFFLSRPLRVVKGVLKEELACTVGYQNSPNVPLRLLGGEME